MGAAMSSSGKPSPLAELPLELLYEITSQVDSIDDLMCLARVNRSFFYLIEPIIYKYDAQGSPGLWPQKPRRILPWALRNNREDKALTSLSYGADAFSVFDLEEAILHGAERVATRLLDAVSIQQELNKPLAENSLQTNLLESAVVNGRKAVVGKLVQTFAPASPFMASVPRTKLLTFFLSNGLLEAFARIFPVLAVGATLEDLEPPFYMAIQQGYQGIFRLMAAQNRELVSTFAFQYAESTGRTEMTDLLIRYGGSLEEALNEPEQLVFRAALWRGNLNRISGLIERAAETTTPDSRAAIFQIASGEYGLGSRNAMKPVDMIKMLLENRFELPLTAQVPGNPCLLEVAVSRNDLELCKYLLEREPDLRQWGISQPIAGIIESCEVCEVLLHHDVDFDQVDPNDGQNPLLIAAQRHVESWDTLVIEGGAQHRLSELSNVAMDVIESLLICGANPRHASFTGATSLHVYAEFGVWTAVAHLLRKGANPNVRNSLGSTPLHLAARFGNVQTVRLLLHASEQGVQVWDFEAKTPLHYACAGDNVETAEYLIKVGAKRDALSSSGKAALHLAHDNVSEDKINGFIRLGVDPNCQDEYGRLVFVTLCGLLDESITSVRLLRTLVQAGANIHLADAQGTTPLYAACRKGHSTRVVWVVGLGAEINVLVRDETALDAIPGTHPDLRHYLVSKGAVTGVEVKADLEEETDNELDRQGSESDEDLDMYDFEADVQEEMDIDSSSL